MQPEVPIQTPDPGLWISSFALGLYNKNLGGIPIQGRWDITRRLGPASCFGVKCCITKGLAECSRETSHPGKVCGADRELCVRRKGGSAEFR